MQFQIEIFRKVSHSGIIFFFLHFSKTHDVKIDQTMIKIITILEHYIW